MNSFERRERDRDIYAAFLALADIWPSSSWHGERANYLALNFVGMFDPQHPGELWTLTFECLACGRYIRAVSSRAYGEPERTRRRIARGTWHWDECDRSHAQQQIGAWRYRTAMRRYWIAHEAWSRGAVQSIRRWRIEEPLEPSYAPAELPLFRRVATPSHGL